MKKYGIAKRGYGKALRQNFGLGGMVIKKISKEAAKAKGELKKNEIIQKKKTEFIKTYGPAKKKLMEDAGLGKEYEKIKNTKMDRSNWSDLSAKMKNLEKKAQEKLGVKEKGPFTFSSSKLLREKYGLKGDSRPEGARRFRGKKVPGKSYEERFINERKMSEEAELKKKD
jgi:hypothetical protein